MGVRDFRFGEMPIFVGLMVGFVRVFFAGIMVYIVVERGGGRGSGCGILRCVGGDVGTEVGFLFVGSVKNGVCIVACAFLEDCSDLGGCGFRWSNGVGARR